MGTTLLFFGRHKWHGESGRDYMFRCALTKHGIPNDAGGIYVFVRRRLAFFLQVLYVGKAANLRGRLVGHEKWGEAWWILGATERYVMRVGSEEERRMIEEDLIRALKPRMNDVMLPRCVDDEPNTLELRRMWRWRRAVWRWLSAPFGLKERRPHEGHDHDRSPSLERKRRRRAAPPDNGFWRRAA